jgi:probable HAF family extracellular repeat protein
VRRILANVTILCLGVVVPACGAPVGPVSAPGPLSQRDASRPSAKPTPTPTPIPFTFTTVDNPNSNDNRVTGINNLAKISGVYGGGEYSNIDEGYTSQTPYSKFQAVEYSEAQGTYAAGLSTGTLVVGYVIDPTSLVGTWGFVRIQGLWSLLEDPKEGSHGNAVTELLGVNDHSEAVGFYTSGAGTNVPFHLDISTKKFTDLHPPGALAAEATGINTRGQIVGWEKTKNGVVGFFLTSDTYYTDWYPGPKATYPLGVNGNDIVAGYYVDLNGSVHGFVLRGPTWGGRVQRWQTVDEPDGARGTWVTGINNANDICGYYKDAKGVRHGFIAIPK